MVAAATSDDIAYLTGLVRAHDRPRYYATLLAPAAVRDDLFALYGFAAEIARVPDQVSEPALGEIRLRWWSERLPRRARPRGEGHADTPRRRGDRRGTACRRGLRSADRRATPDLYSDPPTDNGDLEGRMGETKSALFQMAAIIARRTRAGNGGRRRPRRRRLRYHATAHVAGLRPRPRTDDLPTDILRRAGMSAADLFTSGPHRGLAKAVAELAEIARRHLIEARARVAELPKTVRTVFLPLAVVSPLLAKIESIGGVIGEREPRLSDLKSLLRIGWARLR